MCRRLALDNHSSSIERIYRRRICFSVVISVVVSVAIYDTFVLRWLKDQCGRFTVRLVGGMNIGPANFMIVAKRIARIILLALPPIAFKIVPMDSHFRLIIATLLDVDE
jgi:hypothetical protein